MTMKITRRKSIMAVIGGIFAPAFAGKAETQLYGGAAFPPATQPANIYDNYPKETAPSVDPLYRPRRIAQLKKLIDSGELEDWQKDRLVEEENNSHMWSDIESLKSISTSHKHRMTDNLRKKLRKKGWIEQAMKELKELESRPNSLLELGAKILK